MVKQSPQINRRSSPRSLGANFSRSGRLSAEEIADLDSLTINDDLYPSLSDLVDDAILRDERFDGPSLEELIDAEDRKWADRDRRKKQIDDQLWDEADYVDLFEPDRKKQIKTRGGAKSLDMISPPFWYERETNPRHYDWLNQSDLPFTDSKLVHNFSGDPVDPNDCQRWPNSPLCKGAGESVFDAATGGFGFGLGLDIRQTDCETVLEIAPEFGWVGLPPMVVGIRKPGCKPPEYVPPIPPEGETRDIPLKTFEIGETGVIRSRLWVDMAKAIVTFPTWLEDGSYNLYGRNAQILGYIQNFEYGDIGNIELGEIVTRRIYANTNDIYDHWQRWYGYQWEEYQNGYFYLGQERLSSQYRNDAVRAILKEGMPWFQKDPLNYPLTISQFRKAGSLLPVVRVSRDLWGKGIAILFRQNAYPVNGGTDDLKAPLEADRGNLTSIAVGGIHSIISGTLLDTTQTAIVDIGIDVGFELYVNGETITSKETDHPPETLTEPDMKCCEETNSLVKAIYKRYARQEDWGISVPKSLLGADNSQETIESYPRLFLWFITQFDSLIGEWPLEIEVQKEEGESAQKVSLPNLSELLAEVYALSLSASIDSDTAIHFLSRLAAESVSQKAMIQSVFDYSKANSEFLGYKGNLKKRTIPTAFSLLEKNGEEIKSPTEMLQSSQYDTTGFENEQEDTLVDALKKLLFAAAITKAAFFRGSGNSRGIVSDIAEVARQMAQRIGGDWGDFIEELNDPQSKINKGFPVPEVGEEKQ